MTITRPFSNSEISSMIESFTENEHDRKFLKQRYIEGKTYNDIFGYVPKRHYIADKITLCSEFLKYVEHHAV